MKFEEYEKDQYLVHKNFADIVASILEAALKTNGNTFCLWAVQKRAKDSISLRNKLIKRNLLEHPNIENEIKDLAGCRLIFYSNDDVNKFINSGIVNENFDVNWDESKIHQPVEENQDVTELYRAHHYLVSLKEDRTNLPEYVSFTNLKCEIQIQTILNHAWSETGHDVIYKPLSISGFGAKQYDEIKSRMGKIMQQYLLPAGYEFQKVLHDFKRLSEGKELFDRDILQAIETAADNNERFDIIERFRDHVLPNYDDLAGVFQDVLKIASTTIEFARKTESKPISTLFGEYQGKPFEDVTEAALEVIESIRYIDPQTIFAKLCDFYLHTKSEKEREQVLKVISKLTKHNLFIWQEVGAAIQSLLIQQLSGFNDDQLINLQPVVIEACKEILKPEMEGTTSTYQAINIHTGTVAISDELIDTRRRAIQVLQRLYEKSSQLAEKRLLITAMSNATRQSIRGSSDEMFIMIWNDACSIYEFHLSLVKNESYEILQQLEHDALWTYRRTKPWIDKDEIGADIKDAAERLTTVIQQYRDAINEDEDFVRYKTLVGFESVFPKSWENSNFELEGQTAFRSQKINDYVDAVTTENADEWFEFINFCSKTNSNDLATFPSFIQFLELLSEKKPDIALNYINRLNQELANFLAAFLKGLWKSERKIEAKKVVDDWVEEGLYLNAITRHYRLEGVCDENQLKSVLSAVIESANLIATIELVTICIEHHNETNSDSLINIFLQAIEFLTQHDDARWIKENWFRVNKSTLFDAFDEEQTKIVLKNMIYSPCVNYHEEAVLSSIAKYYPELVINYFNDRIQFNKSNADKNKEEMPYLERYEEVPYKFDSLSAPLSTIPEQAVQIVRAWYAQSSELFTYRGGRLLANIFPSFPDAFQSELIALVQAKSLDDIDFVFSILRNYEGETFTHAICKEIIVVLAEGDQLRQNEVEIILESTGVVRGEFGMSDAYKRKKEEAEPWLTDQNQAVIDFAKRYVRNLDRQIAAEYRRSEQGIELRKRNFGE